MSFAKKLKTHLLAASATQNTCLIGAMKIHELIHYVFPNLVRIIIFKLLPFSIPTVILVSPFLSLSMRPYLFNFPACICLMFSSKKTYLSDTYK